MPLRRRSGRRDAPLSLRGPGARSIAWIGLATILGCGARSAAERPDLAGEAEHEASAPRARGPADQLLERARRREAFFMVLSGVGDEHFCSTWRYALSPGEGRSDGALEMQVTDGTSALSADFQVDAARGMVTIRSSGGHGADYEIGHDEAGPFVWVGDEHRERTHFFVERAACERAASRLGTGYQLEGGVHEREGPPGW